jgi:hypothetical protein
VQKEDADSFVRAVLQRFLEVCQTKFAELHPKMREAAKKSAEAVRHRQHPPGQRWPLNRVGVPAQALADMGYLPHFQPFADHLERLRSGFGPALPSSGPGSPGP